MKGNNGMMIYEAPGGSRTYADIYLGGTSDKRRVIVILRESELSFECLCGRVRRVSFGFGTDLANLRAHIAKQLESIVPVSVTLPDQRGRMGGLTYSEIFYDEIVRNVGQFWDLIHGSRRGVSPTEVRGRK